MRRYLIALIVAIAGLVLAAAAVNALVDPYSLFNAVRMEGFNDVKPRAEQRGLLLRRQLISAQRPRVLIVGNSRAEVGFDPEHPAWSGLPGPVINAAVPGAGIGTVRRLVEHAFAVGDPEMLLVGLDFLDFRVSVNTKDSDHGGLPDRAAASWPLQLSEWVGALLSADALYDSMLTLLAQRDPYSPDVTPLGFNPLRNYLRYEIASGYGVLFLQRNQENARNYLQGPKRVRTETGRSAAFDHLRSMIELARVRGASVHLVIYPYHAHILELFRITGMWPAFEQWKEDLATVVDAENEKSAGSGTRLVLWDFSGYSSYTTEAVPAIGDRRSRVAWYWEAGHFKKELGDVVLGRVLGAPGARSDEDFGVILTRENLSNRLQLTTEQGRRYREQRFEEIRGLESIVQRLQSR